VHLQLAAFFDIDNFGGEHNIWGLDLPAGARRHR
jgi:hypothetical protein